MGGRPGASAAGAAAAKRGSRPGFALPVVWGGWVTASQQDALNRHGHGRQQADQLAAPPATWLLAPPPQCSCGSASFARGGAGAEAPRGGDRDWLGLAIPTHLPVRLERMGMSASTRLPFEMRCASSLASLCPIQKRCSFFQLPGCFLIRAGSHQSPGGGGSFLTKSTRFAC